MLLITETNLDNIKLLKEDNGEGNSNYFIEGIFMQSEKKNKNGRSYPKKTLVNEVRRYKKEYVDKRRALGELGHPEGPTVNLDKVSHVIQDLWEDGNDIYGRAKVMTKTPMGNIVKNLIDEGVCIGVSSRGMGSLKEKDGINEVQDDFILSAVDIVSDPSAPDAFVNGIMEGKEWIWDNGVIKEKNIDEYHQMIKKASKRELEEKAIFAFKDFLSKI